MTENIIIRKAVVEDIPSILELWKEMMDFHKERDRIFSRSETGHEGFAGYVKGLIASETSHVVIAETDKEITGYCLAMIEPYPPVLEMKEYGLIQDIAVTKKYRRYGIGQKLLEEARNWFSEKGIRRIEARVATTNTISTGFWAKMGLKPYLETVFAEI